MRVLEIMGSLHRGGAETMIMNYYRAMDKSLCQMDFVIHAEYDEDYRDEAIRLGAKVILLDRPGEIGAVSYVKKLKESIESNGPYDAIHIHTNHQAFLAMIAGHLAGLKNIIVHSHSAFFSKKYLVINRLFMNLFDVKKVACGIAAGDAFFGVNNYVVINNAIDLKKFRGLSRADCIEKKVALFGNKYVIGNLGRLTKQKNHEFILDVAEQISKIRDDILFACYGEGEDEEKLKKIASERRIDNVLFMGVTNEAVTVYRMLDLFILPSLWEGFPVTLVESQLSGVYSMTSDNVSRECDLNIGMLEYLPLDSAIWVQAIIKNLSEKHSGLDDMSILNAYDVNIQWKELYNLYKRK